MENESKTLVSIFSEYMNLSYSPSKYSLCKDIKLGNYIFCRRRPNKTSIIYLHTGAKFIIPDIWRDIFSGFNVYIGPRLNFIKLGEDTDSIEIIIYLMTSLFMYLDRDLNNNPGQDVLDILGELSLRSTEDFRVWCENNLKINLEPLEFISMVYNLKI